MDIFWVTREMCCIWLQFHSARNSLGHVTLGDLPPVLLKLKNFSELFKERDIKAILSESTSDMGQEIDFESFLRVSFQYVDCRSCFFIFYCVRNVCHAWWMNLNFKAVRKYGQVKVEKLYALIDCQPLQSFNDSISYLLSCILCLVREILW